MFRKEIVDKTLGKIRSFLSEVAYGASTYKSLYSLTEQVEHQYHGRFLIELIQNSHDALDEDCKDESLQRIEIIFDQNEGAHGSLYIANDGEPFNQSNFNALSNLGQSDKDPQKSIGNKGLGFRSVLEITEAPEIYSRATRESNVFDGYCFSFRPKVTQLFIQPIEQVINGDNSVICPFNEKEMFLDWGESQYITFRDKCQTFGNNWLQKELSYLSSYTLPLPIDNENNHIKIEDFQKRGFSTVIRLPLKDEDAKVLVLEKLNELNVSTVVFLERINVLRLESNGKERVYHRRQKTLHEDVENGYEVQIESGGVYDGKDISESRRYWMWSRTVGGKDNTEERENLKLSVSKLPGKWPEVEEATVTLAVQTDNNEEPGLLNIYLPTEVPSGCEAHFNSSFYGDIRRTAIDFSQPYNKLLLETIAEMSVDVILNSLSGNGADESLAIIKILARTEDDEGAQWWECLNEVFDARDIDIDDWEIVLSDKGWNSFNNTKLLPQIGAGEVIDDDFLRSEVTYPVFIKAASKNIEGITRVYDAIGIDFEASESDFAATVEAIAEKLHSRSTAVDWNGFWEDVEDLLECRASSLIGRTIVLGADNELHASDDTCTIFFRPSRGGTDDEVSTEGVEEIPVNLRPYIAFLHEDIRVREKGSVQNTSIHRYLSSDLVYKYGVERILSSVLVKVSPDLPVSFDDKSSDLCSDIIQWGLRLINASTGSFDFSLKHLSKLPVPCVGGWYPLSETSFGVGWPEKCGEDLELYLRSIGTKDSKRALKKVLLPPDSPNWGGMGLSMIDSLEKAGVFNGVRLKSVDNNDWDSKFKVGHWIGVTLPEACPLEFSREVWSEYRGYIESTETNKFDGDFTYQFANIYIIPGYARLNDFDEVTVACLTRLLLASIPAWDERYSGWKKAVINKTSGLAHSFNPISPMAYALSEQAWMLLEIDGKRFEPSKRWYIPSSSMAGGLHQFSHLKPMPIEISSILGRNKVLVDTMEFLGMPKYEPEHETADIRLLDDLAESWSDPLIEVTHPSVFLGQLRAAWHQFYPDENDKFPHSLIVRNDSGKLNVITPSEDEVVYLPDENDTIHRALELHSKSVIAINAQDAKRLQIYFQDAYGDNIRLASELTMKALVNDQSWKPNDGNYLSDEVPWLIPVVLSVVAFSSMQGRGTGTKSFAKVIDIFRRVRVEWVDSLHMGLWHEDTPVGKISLPALWQSKADTVLATSQAKTQITQLSEVMVAVVDRNDLEAHMKLALTRFDGITDVTDDEIYLALEALHITAHHYQEVMQRWIGDLDYIIQAVRPLVLLLQQDANVALLDKVTTEAELNSFLKNCNLSPLDTNKVISIIKNEPGIKAVGYKVWKDIGDRAELSQWNKVLNLLHEPTIKNKQASEQFQDNLEQCHAALCSIIRLVIRKHPEAGTYNDLEANLSDLSCPIEYENQLWVVGFREVMQQAKAIIENWPVEKMVLIAIDDSKNLADLCEKFDKLGMDPDLNPVEIHADNQKLFMSVFEGVRKIAISWCIKNEIDYGIWEKEKEFYIKQLQDDFSKSAFVDIWVEVGCLQIIKKLKFPDGQEVIRNALGEVINVKELMVKLDISESDVAGASGKLEKQKQEKEKRDKTVDVCGVGFVNSDDNLSGLWDHIVKAIDDDNIDEMNLSDFENLTDQSLTKKSRKKSKQPSKTSNPKGRMPQAMKDLIGLAGEIHAYRALQKIYGKEVVGPNNWVSDNSLKKFPENKTNDGIGCDFVIQKDNTKYHIEVKATQQENESFELGSTEVELAVDLAGRIKKQFVILHVINALSNEPQFRLLPNPYTKKYKKKYHFEEAGLRVSYKLP